MASRKQNSVNSSILLLSLFQYNVQFQAGCIPQTAIQYQLSSVAPKSSPLLQSTPGIFMLRHFRTHQKPGKILTLSAGMLPYVQTMARPCSQTWRLSPHHRTTCYVWTEPVQGERCQLSRKGKVQHNSTKKAHCTVEGRHTTGISEQTNKIYCTSLGHTLLAQSELVSVVKLSTTAPIS